MNGRTLNTSYDVVSLRLVIKDLWDVNNKWDKSIQETLLTTQGMLLTSLVYVFQILTLMTEWVWTFIKSDELKEKSAKKVPVKKIYEMQLQH